MFAQMGDFVDWDMHQTRAVSFPIFHNLFDCLTEYDDKGKLRPCLAESWDISEDGKVVTLHLVKGVKFHNGEVFDAHALALNFERGRDETLGKTFYGQTTALESWKILDDSTIETHWSAPTPQWGDIFAWGGIMAPEMIAGDVKVIAIGTGPFKLKEWVPADHATWVKNDEYWKAPLPYLDEVIIKPFTDPVAMLTSFETGALDIVKPVAYPDVGRLKANPKFQFYLQDPGNHYHFTLNCKREPWDRNKKVRQAMQYAVDRKTIIEKVLYGLSEPLWSPFPKESWAYDPAFDEAYPFDLDKAKVLLTEAGYPNGFEVTIKTIAPFAELPEIATILQADWAKIGITANIEAQDTSIWYTDYFNLNYDVNLLFSGLTRKDPVNLFISAAWRLKDNAAGIDEDEPFFEEYENLKIKAESSLDQATRKSLYKRIQEIIVEESWSVQIAKRIVPIGLQKYVRDFLSDPDGAEFFRETWLDK